MSLGLREGSMEMYSGQALKKGRREIQREKSRHYLSGEQYSQGAETHGVGGGEHMRGIRSKWGRRTDAEELVVLCGM